MGARARRGGVDLCVGADDEGVGLGEEGEEAGVGGGAGVEVAALGEPCRGGGGEFFGLDDEGADHAGWYGGGVGMK